MFNKDIVLIDLEFTGFDTTKHEITQFAAVLIDKKTLLIKKEFSSYIKPRNWKHRDPESVAISKITLEQLKDAPSLAEVMKEFKSFVHKDVLLAYYGGAADIDFLRAAYKKVGEKHPFPFVPFDYHLMNLWPIFYAYAGLKNKLTNRKRFSGFSLEDLMKHFKIVTKDRHDALVDCRVEAEILRRIMMELKKKI